ncbi:MgtC/SapB family protein [Streptomyces sp. NPDC046977]|uniref:MgtC/SapB family protein n=1 Tax=Streptomyces sp. NPDC046977 TaxID=3154703 RepID=UPI0033BFC5E3
MDTVGAPLWDVANGQGLRQLAELGLALVLSSLIGWERAAHQKSAGLRTHTLVGVASALMMEVSQHGFTAVLGLENVSFDPSRVAAQIVSGIGFIGGGLIFVRRDAVRGLTTAATVWLTCAIGMACGGGLPILALAATVLHFLVVRGYPRVAPHLRPGGAATITELSLTYRTGTALLPQLMELCTRLGFGILQVKVDRLPAGAEAAGGTRVLLEDDRVLDPGLGQDKVLTAGGLLVGRHPLVDEIGHAVSPLLQPRRILGVV